MKKSLKQFCQEVNALDREACASLNQEPDAIFAAVHHPMPPEMLSYYFDLGLTPQETISEIEANAGF